MTIFRFSIAVMLGLAGCDNIPEQPRNNLERLLIGANVEDGTARLNSFMKANAGNPEHLRASLLGAGYKREKASNDGCERYLYSKKLDWMGQTRDSVAWICPTEVGANFQYTFL